ncbi:MAG: hypothetical protein C0402_07450 [Thermodesulfovibrio sp.]|nr:hypothetical protein [Thermodesulfovibrio sp.]
MRYPCMTKGFLPVICILMAFVCSCSKQPAAYKTLPASDGEIRIALTEVSDGKVHFYTYKKSGRRINFLVRTDSTGELSAYFDACFTCYKHMKGYREEGADIICNECSMKFRLADKKWDNTDGCSPILLKSILRDGFIVIKTEHIEKGVKLFS